MWEKPAGRFLSWRWDRVTAAASFTVLAGMGRGLRQDKRAGKKTALLSSKGRGRGGKTVLSCAEGARAVTGSDAQRCSSFCEEAHQGLASLLALAFPLGSEVPADARPGLAARRAAPAFKSSRTWRRERHLWTRDFRTAARRPSDSAPSVASLLEDSWAKLDRGKRSAPGG